MAEYQQSSIVLKIYDFIYNAIPTTKFMAAATVGTGLLALAGLTTAMAMVALAMATPLLVLFSPVLVPAAAMMSFITGGFSLASAYAVSALATMAWLFRSMTMSPDAAGDLE